MTASEQKDKKPKKDAKELELLQQQCDELTLDLQRTRADFENYRKRAETERQSARHLGESSAVVKLLPVIDDIERAIAHVPSELADNKWAQSVAGLVKKLEKSLSSMNVVRIDAAPGTTFDPELHEAIQVDEEAEGEHEVIAEELQAGYMQGDTPIRHAMVKVTRQ